MDKFFLTALIIILSGNVNAAFTDELQNYGLYHCDSTNVTPWHTETPDDFSSSRAFNPALLEFQSEQPLLVPRSGGGSCFYFDGNNDGLYIPNVSGYIGWPGDKDTFYADVSVKWEELPPASGDNRAGLIVAGTWNIFLRNNGSGKGIIEVLIKNTANQSIFLTSNVTLEQDTWYDVHAQLSNGVVSLTINGTTKTTPMNGTLKQGSIQVEIGQGIYSARYFKGYLDEIRYGFFGESFADGLDNSDVMPLYQPDNYVNMENDSPDWVKTLVMAQLRIETATYTGSFESTISILNHYEEMGVNGLWICPVYKRDNYNNNGYSGFGPQTIDDKIAGTNDIEAKFTALKHFVDEAHARNIRILLDIVDWGIATNSPLATEHPEWLDGYNSNWNGYKFKYDNSEWQEWFINQATNLVFSTGIDGFRCDVEPAITGYGLYQEVRNRCYANGRKIAIISEQFCDRNGTYDFEQIGVGYTESSQWYSRRESGNYYISNNIVDSITSGEAIGIPASQQGTGRFYTYNLSNHDSHYQTSFGNIVRFGYQSIFSPFIPMWYIGEEWNCQRNISQILYTSQINWATKIYNESKANFFAKVKKLIRIRRQYPDIFDYYPANHRDSNICKVNVSGNNLQAYARYRNGRGILIIPNYNDSNNSYSFVPPYNDMNMNGATSYKVTDLINDKVLLTNLSSSANINITISNQNIAVLLIEKDDGSFTPFDDSWNNILLMHCDETNQGYWLITPDDNSTGRDANEPILDMAISSFDFDRTTEPTIMPGSPKGGSFLHFDGINDTVYVNPGWPVRNSVVCDFSIRWLDLPSTSDPYAALVQTVPWRCFLKSNGNKGYISFLIGGTFFDSSKMMDSNTWYDVEFSIIGNHARLVVDGVEETATISISDSSSQIMIGYDLYTHNRFFKGDLDEIRVGIIPEPYYLLFIINYLLFINRRKILTLRS